MDILLRTRTPRAQNVGQNTPPLDPNDLAPPNVEPQPETPRIGGGTDLDTWWTGGSNLNRIERPRSVNARRPTDFRSLEKIESNCTKGLPENRRLGTPDDKEYTISLTAWINEVRHDMESKGMDTVFHVLEFVNVTETYLLTNWGGVSPEMLFTWINVLQRGSIAANITPCRFDQDNLRWSAEAIKNSITTRLYEEIESDLEFGATGPEIFYAIVRRLQHGSASAGRALLQKLQEMKLNKEPGMNVDTFATKITEMIRRLEGTNASSVPSDLSTVVAQCFLDTDVDKFKLEASAIFNRVDLNPASMNWRQILVKLKTKYRSLEGLGRWPHKGKKSLPDEMAALKGTINKLTQQLQQKGNSGGGHNGSNGGGGHGNNSRRSGGFKGKCHNCNKVGHMARDCPLKQSGTSGGDGSQGNNADTSSWRAPPQANEPHTKQVNGTEYKWCGKCKSWRKGPNRHTTAEHKPRPNNNGSNGTNNNSGGTQGAANTAGSQGAANVGGAELSSPPVTGSLRMLSAMMVCKPTNDKPLN